VPNQCPNAPQKSAEPCGGRAETVELSHFTPRPDTSASHRRAGRRHAPLAVRRRAQRQRKTPPGMVFVMGDNGTQSSDSRGTPSETVGVVRVG
jgi:hypothetical protein